MNYILGVHKEYALLFCSKIVSNSINNQSISENVSGNVQLPGRGPSTVSQGRDHPKERLARPNPGHFPGKVS